MHFPPGRQQNGGAAKLVFDIKVHYAIAIFYPIIPIPNPPVHLSVQIIRPLNAISFLLYMFCTICTPFILCRQQLPVSSQPLAICVRAFWQQTWTSAFTKAKELIICFFFFLFFFNIVSSSLVIISPYHFNSTLHHHPFFFPGMVHSP